MFQNPFVKISIVLVFVVVACVPTVWGRARRGDDKLLKKTIRGVELGLSFFSQDYSSINVDGLFGLRVGQGQILQALDECKSSSSCPESIQHRLQKLADGIETTANAAMKYVEDRDPDYYKRFLLLINQPYMLRYTPTMLKDLDKTPAGSDFSYDEEEGDQCFARLMGTFEENGKPVKECNITQSCWDLMTEKNRAKYSITHQLLYFIFLEKQGCVEIAEANTGASVAETERRMCGSIYNEAVTESEEGKVPEMLQDLFMEQALVCGCLGFENFMRSDWIRMVLTWQKPSGCFSLDHPVLLKMETQLAKNNEQERRLLKDLQWEVHMIEEQHHGRKLLREQVMQGGCLSHKSGLGFGALCLYTRYLIRQNFLDQ